MCVVTKLGTASWPPPAGFEINKHTHAHTHTKHETKLVVKKNVPAQFDVEQNSGSEKLSNLHLFQKHNCAFLRTPIT